MKKTKQKNQEPKKTPQQKMAAVLALVLAGLMVLPMFAQIFT